MSGPNLEKMTDEELDDLQDEWQDKEDRAHAMIVDIIDERARRRDLSREGSEIDD